MLSEAMKAIDCVTEEMILEKTGGFEVDIEDIQVIHNRENDDSISVFIFINGWQLCVCFEFSDEMNDIVRTFTWDITLCYDTEEVLISDDCRFTGVTEEDLKAVFGENLNRFDDDGETINIEISMKAFPEFFS
jgi:hypothetical protein